VPEAPEGQSTQGLRARQVALGILATLAVAAVLSYFLSRPPTEAKHVAAVSVREGPSCPTLRQAQSALQSGDIDALRKAIRAATNLAFASLKKDDLAFGKSERIALQLASFRLKDPLPALERAHLTARLKEGLGGCKAISS
jgi:hypothetical protein